jgi:hypothetical protein
VQAAEIARRARRPGLRLRPRPRPRLPARRHLAWWLGCVLLGFGKGRPAAALAMLAAAGFVHIAVLFIQSWGPGLCAWASSCAVVMLGSFAVGNIRADEPAYPVTPTDGGK